MDREAWHAAVHGVAKSQTWLTDWTELIHMHLFLYTLLYSKWTTTKDHCTVPGICSMLSSNLICKIIWKRLGFIVNMLGRNIRKTLITWFGFKYDLKQASQVTLVVKDSPANAGDTEDEVLIPGSRRSPGGGHGNSLPYSCLENPLDREPGGQQFIRSQRVGHDWSNLAGLRVLHIITHR